MDPDIGRQVDINLASSEEGAPAPRAPLADLAFTVLAVLAVVMLIVLLFVAWTIRSDTGTLNQRLSVAQAAMKQPTGVPSEVVAQRTELDATKKQANALDTDLATISSRRINWSPIIASIWNAAGPNVNVAFIQTAGSQVTVRGDASSLDGVTAYSDRLQATGLYNNVIIEMVTTQGTPPPVPTAVPPAGTPVATPTGPVPTLAPTYPVASPSPTYPLPLQPTATPIRYYPTPTPWYLYPIYPIYPIYPSPTPYYPIYPIYPTAVPTVVPSPTWTSVPSPTPSPTPFTRVRLRDIVFSPTHLPVGGILRVDIWVDNIGTTTLIPQDQPAPGYTYTQGQTSPSGYAGRWRVAADEVSYAAAGAARYRWGLGGPLAPGQSRHVIGYIKLVTPGTYTYCAGIVQEFVSWPVNCQGAVAITVAAPSPSPAPSPSASATSPVAPSPTRTPTFVIFPTPTTTVPSCADGYEPDNTWPQARVIGANSSLPQVHNFDVFGDTDWVKFAVSPGITYTMRTKNLTNGIDTMMTLYGNHGGVLYQLAQNDEDPNNGSAIPPVVGPSRLDFSFTVTDTAYYGTTFYAMINSPNPANFGCNKAYNLTLTTTGAYLEPGIRFVRMLSPNGAAGPLQEEQAYVGPNMVQAPDAVLPEEVQQGRAANLAPLPRFGFTLILTVRGGGP